MARHSFISSSQHVILECFPETGRVDGRITNVVFRFASPGINRVERLAADQPAIPARLECLPNPLLFHRFLTFLGYLAMNGQDRS